MAYISIPHTETDHLIEASGDNQEDGNTTEQKVDINNDVAVAGCPLEDEASYTYCTNEILESLGVEEEFQENYKECKKYRGHQEFVDLKVFNMYHLPVGCQDNDIVELIKSIADLTVRILGKRVSSERPALNPLTKKTYPLYERRGTDYNWVGTGMVNNISPITEPKTLAQVCHCGSCKGSDTPGKVTCVVSMATAKHVVFDEFEATHVSCRLFFDEEDSPPFTLDGWTVSEGNLIEDSCVLKCEVCDVVLNRLQNVWMDWHRQSVQVYNKYECVKEKPKLIIIVSHPHGIQKKVSVGLWEEKSDINTEDMDGYTYTYTTCTCKGSSGAPVFALELRHGMFYSHHTHSGYHRDKVIKGTRIKYNYSGTGKKQIKLSVIIGGTAPTEQVKFSPREKCLLQ